MPYKLFLQPRFSNLILLLFVPLFLSAQNETVIWHNSITAIAPVVEGKGWPQETKNNFNRLPERFKSQVREPVWNLSTHASGLYIKFQTNTTDIRIRYQVSKQRELQHIPATGASGLDLYAKDSDGNWLWCRPGRNFGDTISYNYRGLKANDAYHNNGRSYYLYLPYFNHVEWLEIGVSQNDQFSFIPLRKEKSIVSYGTSIMHGACATRPGLTWANILGRSLDRPIINLGFSGNGRLESELIEALVEIDAKLYILDCLPNLWNDKTYDDQELTSRIINSITTLKKQKPDTPILLVDHAGYTDGRMQPSRQNAFVRVNRIQQEAYSNLLQIGIAGIHYLSYEEIGLSMEGMVDGTHPNDLGMMQYAKAYEKKIRIILDQPKGNISTTRPISQNRDGGIYHWHERHQEILKLVKDSPPKGIIIGNSITHFWGGNPSAPIARESTTWDSLLTPLRVMNFGFGWDRIENVLWRVNNDELDGYELDNILLMLGTNNLHLNTDEEILEGLQLLIQAILLKQPSAKITLGGILPRRDGELRIKSINLKYARLSAKLGISYKDFGHVFLNGNQINENLFSDGLHPNKDGYLKLRDDIYNLFKQ